MREVFAIAGIKHHVFLLPKTNDSLVLVPEPNNEYDRFAVAVYNTLSQKIGYVPKYNNKNTYILAALSRYTVSVRVIAVSPHCIFVEMMECGNCEQKYSPKKPGNYKTA